jgi:hypothetical protein
VLETNQRHKDKKTMLSNSPFHNNSHNMPRKPVLVATFSFFADDVLPCLPDSSHRSFDRFSISCSPSLYKICHNVQHTHIAQRKIEDHAPRTSSPTHTKTHCLASPLAPGVSHAKPTAIATKHDACTLPSYLVLFLLRIVFHNLPFVKPAHATPVR